MVCNYHLTPEDDNQDKTKECVICLELGTLEIIREESFSSDSLEEGTEEKDFWKSADVNIFNIFKRIKKLRNIRKILKSERSKIILKIIAGLIFLSVLLVYYRAVLLLPTHNENFDYWCHKDGFLILSTIFLGTLFIYFQILKPYCGDYIFGLVRPYLEKLNKFGENRNIKFAKVIIFLGSILIFVSVDIKDEPSRLIPVFGIIVLLFLATLFSSCPLKIKTNQILSGVGLHLALGLIIFRWSGGKDFINCFGGKASTFLSFTEEGIEYLFGNGDQYQYFQREDKEGYLVRKAFQKRNLYIIKMLPTILFFGIFTSLLYHFGIAQWIVKKLGWFLGLILGTSNCEGTAIFINVFTGQGLSQLAIQPYLSSLTKSEISSILTAGYTATAPILLASYPLLEIDFVTFFGASLMNMSAAVVISKLFLPETKNTSTDSEGRKNKKIKSKREEKNITHVVVKSVMNNISLVLIPAAVWITVCGLRAWINSIADWGCQLTGFEEGVCHSQRFLGYILYPFAWLMGIPAKECTFVGHLLGTKIMSSEDVALQELVSGLGLERISIRTYTIATYALSGFSSLSAMGCQIGIMCYLAPSRIRDCTSIAFRSLIAGNLACYLTACMAGFLYVEPAITSSL